MATPVKVDKDVLDRTTTRVASVNLREWIYGLGQLGEPRVVEGAT